MQRRMIWLGGFLATLWCSITTRYRACAVHQKRCTSGEIVCLVKPGRRCRDEHKVYATLHTESSRVSSGANEGHGRTVLSRQIFS